MFRESATTYVFRKVPPGSFSKQIYTKRGFHLKQELIIARATAHRDKGVRVCVVLDRAALAAESAPASPANGERHANQESQPDDNMVKQALEILGGSVDKG